MSPVVLRRVEILLHLLCGFQDEATVSFVLDTRVDRRVALSRSKYSAPACLIVDDTELSVTPMIHGSTLEMHESSPTTLGSCEGYDTVGDAVGFAPKFQEE